jgi:hypothetical protein
MRRLLFLAVVVCAVNATAGTGKFIVLNSDKPGTGFNDPTPVAPIGGNPGTTLGAQRLNVFAEAAKRWENALDTNVDVKISAQFSPIPGGCSDSGITLGYASPTYWNHSTPGTPRANVWYPAALLNKFAGTDLEPARNDIDIRFNADIDSATCLPTGNWYYGFDGNHGADVDLFVVVLHEIAHGLGLSGASGGSEFSQNRPSVFNTHMLDLLAGLSWDQMTPEQRRVSSTNTGNVVWTGPNVVERAPSMLAPLTTLAVTQPASVARDYDLGFAAFGGAASSSTLAGRIVQGRDGDVSDGSTPLDGCSPLTNAAEIAGNIALLNRGNCTYVVKARNAQNAGALGVIISNVASPARSESCLPMSMASVEEDDDITIPVLSVATRDGDALKAQLAANATVNANLRVDPSQRLGASKEGYVRLYIPCSFESGSSVYHWDIMTSPNLLMEPDINTDLVHGLDLTLYQLLDIGWTLPSRTGRRILKR